MVVARAEVTPPGFAYLIPKTRLCTETMPHDPLRPPQAPPEPTPGPSRLCLASEVDSEATGGDRRRPEATGGDRRRSPSKTTALLIPINNKTNKIHCRPIATATERDGGPGGEFRAAGRRRHTPPPLPRTVKKKGGGGGEERRSTGERGLGR